MGADRINFWKITNDYNYAHGVTPKPEWDPTEPTLPCPTFKVGDLVKMTPTYEDDSGRARKRRGIQRAEGTRLITEADRAEYAREWWATFNSPLNRMTRAETEHTIRMMFPVIYVDVHVNDVFEVVTPVCTHHNAYSPTWSGCEVLNPRTGEQFVMSREELELA